MRPLMSITAILVLFACNVQNESKMSSGKLKANNTEGNAYSTFRDMIGDADAKYRRAVRITSAGSATSPTYHGFFFYNCAPRELLQFDPSGKYMLAMQVSIEGKVITHRDSARIGIIDLQNNNEWTQIGSSTAWTWQQGCRLQWIPGSSTEIIWNDRSDDGKSYVSRIYNTQTKTIRTLPRPVYTISPDGTTALTHAFDRMEKDWGTGLETIIHDSFEKEWAPDGTGMYKMDMRTGESKQMISVRQMAHQLYPNGLPPDTVGGTLFFFREGYNPSGSRFILFVKDTRIKSPGDTTQRTVGYSMTPDAKDIRYLYEEPSHHYWMNDQTIIDNVRTSSPGEQNVVTGYYEFKDDNSGQPKKLLWAAPNGHDSFHPSGEWILTDTYSKNSEYPLNGYQYLYLYHIPTRKLVALGKYAYMFQGKFTGGTNGTYRVDLHPRFTPDGKKVCFDSTHEGLGRQIYLVDIEDILNNPPK